MVDVDEISVLLRKIEDIKYGSIKFQIRAGRVTVITVERTLQLDTVKEQPYGNHQSHNS